MADEFTPPSIDWTSSRNAHKRFKLFRQKCEFTFEGPLGGVEKKNKQVRHLLLWDGDKGLIFNTTTWINEDSEDKMKEVLDALENYTKTDKKSLRKPFKFKSNGCFTYGSTHDKSGVKPRCKFCGKQGHFIKVCLKRAHQRVHQIGTSDKTFDTTDTSVFLQILASEKT